MKNNVFILGLLCSLLCISCSEGDGGLYGTGTGGGGVPNNGQVLLGPVIAAQVTVQALYDASHTILCEVTTKESDDINIAGTFTLPAGCVKNDNTLYQLTATGGFDIDIDDDGIIDGPTPLEKPVRSIVKGSDLFQVSDWKINQLTENITDVVLHGKEELDLSAAQITMVLELASGNSLSEDISGNNNIDYADVLQWNPRDDQAIVTDNADDDGQAFFEKHEIILNDFQAAENLEGTWVVLSYNLEQTSTPINDEEFLSITITGRYKEVCTMRLVANNQYETNCIHPDKTDIWTLIDGKLINDDSDSVLELYQNEEINYQQLSGDYQESSIEDGHRNTIRVGNIQMVKVAPLQTSIGSLTLLSEEGEFNSLVNTYTEMEGFMENNLGLKNPYTITAATLTNSTTSFLLVQGSYVKDDQREEGGFLYQSILSDGICGTIEETTYCDYANPLVDGVPVTMESLDQMESTDIPDDTSLRYS
ncbi:MAG: hypothetical protein HRU20_28325, partial [Pseudomonadales bacterium]|nr:hypothetical protein [Pseudomonadales bacterium]